MIDLGVDKGVIEKSGAWFAYKGERMGQGRENVKQFLKDNSDICRKIEEELRKSLNIPVNASSEQGNAPAAPDIATRSKATRG